MTPAIPQQNPLPPLPPSGGCGRSGPQILRLRRDESAATQAIDRAFELATGAGLPAGRIARLRKMKVGLLHELGRPAEAQLEYLKLKGIPGRDPQLTAKQIDISPFYNATPKESWLNDPELPRQGFRDWNSLGRLPIGAIELGGILFALRGLIQLDSPGLRRIPGRQFPEPVNDIPVAQRCQNLHFLHAAAYASGDPDGSPPIGSYFIRSEDGESVEIPIELGKDLADWHINSTTRETNTPAGKDGFRIAWEGSNNATERNGTRLALYLTNWENPRPDSPVKSLDFKSAGRRPAPFLVALSAE